MCPTWMLDIPQAAPLRAIGRKLVHGSFPAFQLSEFSGLHSDYICRKRENVSRLLSDRD